MRILLIEDDADTARAIKEILRQNNYVVDTTSSGEEALEIIKIYLDMYDLVILDLMLPDIRGSEVIRRLRASKINVPVLVLSGLNETSEKVNLLGFGADDYITKPYEKNELLARVSAIIRRAHGHAQEVIRVGKRLMLDLKNKVAMVDEEPLPLSNKEYAILELLAVRQGTTLTKEMFLNHLYGGLDEPELKIVDVFVCKLRKKLAQATNGEKYIETVWGRGYVLRNPEASQKETKGTKNVFKEQLETV
ncbi:MAG: response regulator transcription factor [Alphaproteobacteria bacterium]